MSSERYSCQLRRQEKDFYKVPNRVALTAPND